MKYSHHLLKDLEIPFLSFITVLLYRIDRWDLTVRDEELRVTVYQTFLEQSLQDQDLMNDEELRQAADVILTMLQILQDSHNTKSIKLKEAILLLELLARLMVVYNRNEETTSDRVTLCVIPPSDLLVSIEQCVEEKNIFQPPKCDTRCVNELDIWNNLLSIQFPSSYQWVACVSERFSKRLKSHRLICLLDSIIYLCNSCAKEEVLTYLFEIIRGELYDIVTDSQTQMKDEQSIIQTLEKVPRDQFNKVIDVFAKIILLHKSAITGSNPLEHVFSLPWLPSVLKQCDSSMFDFIESSRSS